MLFFNKILKKEDQISDSEEIFNTLNLVLDILEEESKYVTEENIKELFQQYYECNHSKISIVHTEDENQYIQINMNISKKDSVYNFNYKIDGYSITNS